MQLDFTKDAGDNFQGSHTLKKIISEMPLTHQSVHFLCSPPTSIGTGKDWIFIIIVM